MPLSPPFTPFPFCSGSAEQEVHHFGEETIDLSCDEELLGMFEELERYHQTKADLVDVDRELRAAEALNSRLEYKKKKKDLDSAHVQK